MQVAQRSTSVTNITGNSYNTADRWQTVLTSLGTWTQSVEVDAPTGSGLRKSLKLNCTVADASPAAGDEASIQTVLEGQNLQVFRKGTSDAKQFALQFWVKSNKTGTYTVWLADNTNSRQISSTYTIDASATWEKKTIIFSADTSGAFANDNTGALNVRFYLAAGSNFTSGTLNTSWTTNPLTNTRVSSSQANLGAATSNYWQITGVQLEAASAITDFEFEPYEDVLRKCQRYYFRYGGSAAYERFGIAIGTSGTAANALIQHPVAMRTGPSVNLGTSALWDGVNLRSVTSLSIDQAGIHTSSVTINVATGLAAGGYYHLLSNGSTSGYFEMSAEL
jgi:hypothetical protein